MKVLLRLSTIAVILAAITIAAVPLIHNYKLKANYKHNEEGYKYKEALAGGGIDVKEVQKLFSSIETAIGYNLTNEISAPVTIHYYKKIGDKAPVYVIKKGTRIGVKKENNSLSVRVGYGLDSMPTGAEGWRIAYPFDTGNGISNELLYVKIDKLMDVADSWVNANDYLVKLGRKAGLTKQSTIKRVALMIDHKLYDSGIYLSPDLFDAVFTIPFFVLSSQAFLSVFLISVKLKSDKRLIPTEMMKE